MKNVFRPMMNRGFVHHFQSSRPVVILHLMVLIALLERLVTQAQLKMPGKH